MSVYMPCAILLLLFLYVNLTITMNPLSSKVHSLAQTRQTKRRTNRTGRTENQHERDERANSAPKSRACADVIQLCLRDHDLVGVACRDFGKMSILVWQKNAVFVNFQVPQRQIILCQKVKAMFIAPVRCAKIVQFTRWSHGVMCKSESGILVLVYQYWYYSCQIYQPLPQWNTYIGTFMCQMLSKIGVSSVSYWYMCSVIPIIYQCWYLSCQIYHPLSNELPILVYVSIKCCLKLEYHWYLIGKCVQEFQ